VNTSSTTSTWPDSHHVSSHICDSSGTPPPFYSPQYPSHPCYACNSAPSADAGTGRTQSCRRSSVFSDVHCRGVGFSSAFCSRRWCRARLWISRFPWRLSGGCGGGGLVGWGWCLVFGRFVWLVVYVYVYLFVLLLVFCLFISLFVIE